MEIIEVFYGLLTALAGYFLGSVNSAVLVSHILYKDDIRRHGSGNAGSTNVGRTYGVVPGILTLSGDLLKTAVAMLIGGALLGPWGKMIAFIACFLGHCYPVFFKFHGGKGVSVCFCAALMIDWRLFIVMGVIFVLLILITRIVSISSLTAVFSLIPISFIFGLNSAPELISVFFAFVMVTYAHRTNIKRLFRGEETKFHFKK